MMTLAKTAVAPQTEYMVITTCGRHFGRHAEDMDVLFRDLHFDGYKAKEVHPMTEYQAEIEAKEQQELEMHEFRIELERELKESA